MKKMLIIILILLFVFSFIRITTSTYENFKRSQNINTDFIPEEKNEYQL